MSPLDRVTQVSQTKPWHGEIPTHYQYTFGVAGERFFREIYDNGKLYGAKCQGCNLVYVPPKMYCEQCFEELKDWQEVGNKGSVVTYTVAHVGLDGSRLEQPVIMAMVLIDGAHGGLVHMLGEVKPDAVKIGMKVEAVIKDKADRTGGIHDIKYFRPVK